MNLNEKFDLFLSYNWGIKENVRQLYQKFTTNHNLKVWIDDEQLDNAGLYEQICEGIKNSKCFVCCITKKYTESANCQREISYATNINKPLIVLMFEDLAIADISGSVGFIITPLLRFNLFNDMHTIPYGDWGSNMNSAIKAIESKVKVNESDSKTNDFSLDSINKSFSSSNIMSNNPPASMSVSNPIELETIVMHFNDGVYEGQAKNGNREGRGLFKYYNGMTYDGEWKNGLQHGIGKETFPSNDSYRGEFKNGRKNGKGVYTFSNGDLQKGVWRDNQISGVAKYYYKNGDKFEGEHLNGVRNGKGVYTYKNGEKRESNWVNGVEYSSQSPPIGAVYYTQPYMSNNMSNQAVSNGLTKITKRVGEFFK